MSKRSIVAFEDVLVNAVAYFRKEWNISNAEVIGVMQIVLSGLVLEDLDEKEAGH